MSHHKENETFDPSAHKWGYEINSGLLAVVGIAGAILTYVICIAVQATYLKSQDEFIADQSWNKINTQVLEYQDNENVKLNTPDNKNPEKPENNNLIPIEQSIDAVVAEQTK